jgi:hypothetical protein
MATCPICGFQRTTSAFGRFELCPRCHVTGTDVQLEEDETPRRRRRDLIGLLTAARAQLASARAVRPTSGDRSTTARHSDVRAGRDESGARLDLAPAEITTSSGESADEVD